MTHAAIVLGGASCVWFDLVRTERMIGKQWPGLVVAVNDVGVTWTRDLDGWCSLHGERLLMNDTRGDRREKRPWVLRREAAGLPAPRAIAVTKPMPKAKREPTHVFKPRWNGGSSGLYGVEFAERLGATRIILCGIPMSPTPHFRESELHDPSRPWTGASGHLRVWISHHLTLKRHVRSWSGKTGQLLGQPTLEWLNEPTGDDDG